MVKRHVQEDHRNVFITTKNYQQSKYLSTKNIYLNCAVFIQWDATQQGKDTSQLQCNIEWKKEAYDCTSYSILFCMIPVT